MGRLIVERLIHSIFVTLGATLIVFGLLHFTGGNIASSLLPEWATEEQIAECASKLGLDLPMHLQHLHWLGNVAQGDFGDSLQTGLPAMEIILERLPATTQLAVTATVIAALVAFPLGTLSETCHCPPAGNARALYRDGPSAAFRATAECDRRAGGFQSGVGGRRPAGTSWSCPRSVDTRSLGT